MTGVVTVQETKFWKPNMNNLKGKKGRAILTQLRNLQPASTEEMEKEADECMRRILAKRQNEKTT